jgi:hypothetical protein
MSDAVSYHSNVATVGNLTLTISVQDSSISSNLFSL